MKRMSRKKQEKLERRERELFNDIASADSHLVIKLLRKGVSPNCIAGSFGRSPLSYACQLGHLDIANILIHNGANINVNIAFGCHSVPPLISAIESGCVDIVAMLLQRGAIVQISFYCRKINAEVNPLHFACLRGQSRIVRMLAEHGCDIEQESSEGLRPIHYAVKSDRINTIEELSNSKANLNAKENSQSGNTPLHVAVIHNSYTAVKCLVQLHVDINAVNSYQETAMDIAKAKNFDRIYALLQQTQADMQYKLNIEKLTNVTADTQHRLAKVEDTTSRLEDQLPSRIAEVVDHKFKQLMSCYRRSSIEMPFGNPGYPELDQRPGYPDLDQRSDYASLEALCENEELPALVQQSRAHSFAHLPYYPDTRRRPSAGSQECSERILTNYTELLSEMKAAEMIPILLSRRAINLQDLDYLDSNCKSEREKNRYILRYVIMRGPSTTFRIFRQALKETDQMHLFDLLGDPRVMSQDLIDRNTRGSQTIPCDLIKEQDPDISVMDHPEPKSQHHPEVNKPEITTPEVDKADITSLEVQDTDTKPHKICVFSRNESNGRAEPVEHVFRLDACEGTEQQNEPVTTENGITLDTPLLPKKRKYRKNKMKRRWHTLATVHVVHTEYDSG